MHGYLQGLHPVSPRVRPLVWIGAAKSHLQALHRLQRKAMKLICDQTRLPTLTTRRLVSALSYFYKLQCISGPAQLTIMVDPPALPTPHQRTVPNKEIATSINFPVHYREPHPITWTIHFPTVSSAAGTHFH